jgi:hypothetical protein
MIAVEFLEHWAKDHFAKNHEGPWLRSAAASVGATMLLSQLRSPLKIRPAKLAVGAALLAGASVPWEKLFQHHAKPEGTPSYRDDNCISCQRPADEIDEMSMESFPASDPPAHRKSSRA